MTSVDELADFDLQSCFGLSNQHSVLPRQVKQGLEQFQIIDSYETLLEFMESTTPSLNGGNISDMSNTFEIVIAPGSVFPNPFPTAIVTDDLEILDSSTILHSYEQDMLLSGFRASSNLCISGDELYYGLEYSDSRNLPSELNYPLLSWLHHDFATREVENTAETCQTRKSKARHTEPNWFQETGKQTDIQMHKGLLYHPRADELQGFSNPPKLKVNSVSDLLTLLDSSDNSDAKAHVDEGKKRSHGKTMTSKNLLSERRRRCKLNERLYALRAMVPKISKMDKASIVTDCISYIRDLQKQVKEMETNIANDLRYGADSSAGRIAHPNEHAKQSGAENAQGCQVLHILEQFEVFPMEEHTYHLRINCKKSPAVLVRLAKALEALEIELLHANLTSVNDNAINTFVVKVKNGEVLNSAGLREMALAASLKFGLQF